MTESVFVARESELEHLHGFLEKTLTGEAQVCFVTGDAGAGKSALLGELARRAEAGDTSLLVAQGECNAQTGLGDPFLPFREILAQLTGDTDTKVAGGKITAKNAERLSNFVRVSGRALVEVSPDIIGTLIPGSLIVARAAKIGADKAGWLAKLEKKAAAPPVKLEENMIFQQVATLLTALAKEQPLLLLLDDLQWADNASIAMLFHLSRALKAARILIVGAYRPNDVALGRDGSRHPLEAMLNEIKRYRGDVLIDLSDSAELDRRAFVEALINSEPNRLSAEFRAALFAHTGGYPLFTVELLRTMQERGDLVWDETAMCWTQPGLIDWDNLPARVEGVIEERIGRLTETLRDVLTTASVEGTQFTTQVVARVRGLTERDLLKSLSDELERRHRLVRESGEEKVGSTRLWHYQFSHVLFQKYLYDDLSRGERRLLNGEVARILEDLYGERAEVIAVQLAHHYEEAGEDEKAALYHRRAGELAAAAYGNHEALSHFSRALELVPEADSAVRNDLYLARGEIRIRVGDFTNATQDFKIALQLALTRGDLVGLENAYMLLNESLCAESRFAEAIALGEYLRQTGPSELALCAEFIWGAGLAVESAHATQAEQHLHEAERLLALPRPFTSRITRALLSYQLGSVMSQQGRHDEAVTFSKEALRLSEQGESGLDLLRQIMVYNHIAYDLLLLGDVSGADYARAGIKSAQEKGMISHLPYLLSTSGEIALAQHDLDGAEQFFRQGLAIAEEVNAPERIAGLTANLGLVAQARGQSAEARAYLRQALVHPGAVGNKHLAVRIRLWLAPLLPKEDALACLSEARAIAESGGFSLLLNKIDELEQQLR